ncbi:MULTISPECIES: hypothetical protein [unclassified Streptomyces]|nr:MULTISPECIES: hypothetical protein [unclassified Streptomyces]
MRRSPSTQIALPLPGGRPVSLADRRRELVAVIQRFAPHVDTSDL